jgi:hypothetical protein
MRGACTEVEIVCAEASVDINVSAISFATINDKSRFCIRIG